MDKDNKKKNVTEKPQYLVGIGASAGGLELTFRITKYRNIDYRQTLKKAGKIKIKSGNYRYQSA